MTPGLGDVIADHMFVHTASVEPVAAHSPYGDTYGPPVEVGCLVNDKVTVVRGPEGNELVSNVVVAARVADAAVLAVGARVTAGTRPPGVVVAQQLADTDGMFPDHVLAWLGA